MQSVRLGVRFGWWENWSIFSRYQQNTQHNSGFGIAQAKPRRCVASVLILEKNWAWYYENDASGSSFRNINWACSKHPPNLKKYPAVKLFRNNFKPLRVFGVRFRFLWRESVLGGRGVCALWPKQRSSTLAAMVLRRNQSRIGQHRCGYPARQLPDNWTVDRKIVPAWERACNWTCVSSKQIYLICNSEFHACNFPYFRFQIWGLRCFRSHTTRI